jgi:hypothetical protein
MIALRTDYDVKCLMCGTEVGQILDGAFKKHAGCTAGIRRERGLPRCCHCGGSLYFDPIDYSQLLDRARLARLMGTAAA